MYKRYIILCLHYIIALASSMHLNVMLYPKMQRPRLDLPIPRVMNELKTIHILTLFEQIATSTQNVKVQNKQI